jgi:hypothetical protein
VSHKKVNSWIAIYPAKEQFMRTSLLLSAGLATLLYSASVQAQPKNVLFYGNSFTLGSGSTDSVNGLFEDIAIAAGQDVPLVQSAAASGRDIEWHVANNTTAIFTLIPPDRDWDFIVMQEHSTKLTRVYTGSPAFPLSIDESEMNVVDLYNTATQRSSDVVPVLYETWARGPGHAFYTGNPADFPGGPAEMQAEVRNGYESLKDALDTEIGSDTALIAPVGDAWENANYDQLHANDLWHAQNRGTLLAALVIYSTVYSDNTSDIDLSGVLASLNLTPIDGEFLTAVADRTTAIPEPGGLMLLCLGSVGYLLRIGR